VSTRVGKARESRAAYAEQPAAKPARALLDVNVLIALLDADHLHHRNATRSLARNIAAGWASCAITQNSCVRIMSQPGYPNPVPAEQVGARLAAATQTRYHLFVASNVSLLDAEHFHTGQLLGHRQVTDAYLLGLAVAHGLRFVTFDASVALCVVRGGTAAHVVVL